LYNSSLSFGWLLPWYLLGVAEEVLREFRPIGAVALLPAAGKPLFGINFHAENITTAAVSRKVFTARIEN
jgi:hypothetical protein